MSLLVDIEKDFGGFKLQTAFETENEVLGILGASGCGKSMTLRCVAGIVKPDRGRIILNGTTLFDSEKKINLTPQERHVGLLFQNYALFPNMTVWQNLETGLRVHEKDKAKASKAIAEMVDKFYLTGLEKHRPSQLSGGQQQRVALARILLTKPNLLMLDEPFSALDGFLRWNLELELTDLLKEFGGSTLFVSHSRDEVYRICDRVCVMDKGESSPVISVKTLFEKPVSLAAAQLSGCKNYSEAAMMSADQVKLKDWGLILNCNTLSTEEAAQVRYVGIRSHFMHPVTQQEAESIDNIIPCRITRVVEDVFSMVIMVVPTTEEEGITKRFGEQNIAQIRLEMSKDEWRQYREHEPEVVNHHMWVHVDEKDILLLK